MQHTEKLVEYKLLQSNQALRLVTIAPIDHFNSSKDSPICMEVVEEETRTMWLELDRPQLPFRTLPIVDFFPSSHERRQRW